MAVVPLNAALYPPKLWYLRDRGNSRFVQCYMKQPLTLVCPRPFAHANRQMCTPTITGNASAVRSPRRPVLCQHHKPHRHNDQHFGGSAVCSLQEQLEEIRPRSPWKKRKGTTRAPNRRPQSWLKRQPLPGDGGEKPQAQH